MSARPLARIPSCLVWIFASCLFAASNQTSPEDPLARALADSGYTGGLVVYLGDVSAVDPFSWPHLERSLVLLLDTDAARVTAFRRKFAQAPSYGSVSADTWDGRHIPLVDRLASRIIVSPDVAVDRKELQRVLSPRGKALLREDGRWTQIEKEVPSTIDEWTHYFHDPTGNAVAHDQEVAPPRHLQWLGSPRWSRHHDRMASMSALVSSGGRIFYILDEGSRASIQLPAHWKLVARDAFNGVVLWKRSIDRWHNHLWPLKSGPTQLARRLVADGDRLYVTLGIKAPVTMLDAASGETLRTFSGTDGTEEILHDRGTLFLLVNPGPSELDDYAPLLNVGDQRRVAQQWHWNERPRFVKAVDTATGKTLWQLETKVAPFSLTVGTDDVVFHDGTHLVSLDRHSGKRRWAVPASRRETITMNFGPRVVLYEDVVLYAGGDRKMAGFDRASGKKLWEAEHPRSSYESPEDLLVIDGLVWAAPTRSTRDSGVFRGRDPRTGEVKVEFPPDVETYWFHHRCYMAKATDRFLLPSRTGIEFVDPKQRSWTIHHWVRGGCLFGILPSNGLVYTPPHDCACYPETKLWGLNALAPHSPSRERASTPGPDRLSRGPAYDAMAPADRARQGDWPTYRGSAQRHGHHPDGLAGDKLTQRWHRRLDGPLTAPTVARGLLFVAQIDQHTLHAFDAETGDTRWSFTAGGRIDSPPTWFAGRVYFGSADGFVYCLRDRDGELVWKFRAAPRDMRLVAMEQIESVWPVHGSVLVDRGEVCFVAGRSAFLDGGLRFLRLDAASGRLLHEARLDEIDPATGKPLQDADYIKVLNMPVGLPDILTTDGKYFYMRSQKLDRDGNRLDLAPPSGDPVATGAAQRGNGIHLFAPLGFLDDSWFHRGYWVWGKHFAGGHAGYYQAGRFTPSGRLLVVDDDSVFGFARKPQYYRWTTVLEHHLFRASKEPPEVPAQARQSARQGAAHVLIPKAASLDPKGKDLVVEAWVYAERPGGTVVAHGGSNYGYALDFRQGRPRFLVRADGKLAVAAARRPATRRWVHLAGVLSRDGSMRLFVDGKEAATARAAAPLQQPAENLQIGADLRSTVGEYRSPNGFGGVIDHLVISHGTASPQELAARATDPTRPLAGARAVLQFSFAKGKADDESGRNHTATIRRALVVEGRFGEALRFRNRGRNNASYVRYQWTRDLPIFVEAIVSAGDRLVVAGPPDVIDEEETFERLTRRDATVKADLRKQEAAWTGRMGTRVLVLSKKDGTTLLSIDLPSLVRWDGMAVADRRLYLTGYDGKIFCLEASGSAAGSRP